MPDNVVREAEALARVGHPNVLSLVDVVARGSYLCLATELCMTDLHSVIQGVAGPIPLGIVKARRGGGVLGPLGAFSMLKMSSLAGVFPAGTRAADAARRRCHPRCGHPPPRPEAFQRPRGARVSRAESW